MSLAKALLTFDQADPEVVRLIAEAPLRGPSDVGSLLELLELLDWSDCELELELALDGVLLLDDETLDGVELLELLTLDGVLLLELLTLDGVELLELLTLDGVLLELELTLDGLELLD